MECIKDIGGIEFFVKDNGNGSIILFESGYGNDSNVWNSIYEQVSLFSRAIAYDRAGLGKSSQTKARRTIDNQARELTELIASMSLKEPIYIVAHSFGSHIARLFAYLHPSMVRGLILIDPSHEEQEDKMKDFLPGREIMETWYEIEGSYDDCLLSDEIMKKVRFEGDNYSFPIYIFTAGIQPIKEVFPIWKQLHEDILTTINGGKYHQVIEDSPHYIHLEQPEIIINVIKDIVQNKILLKL